MRLRTPLIFSLLAARLVRVTAFVPSLAGFGQWRRQPTFPSTSERNDGAVGFGSHCRRRVVSMMLPTTRHGRPALHPKRQPSHHRQHQEKRASSATRLFGVVDNIKRYLFREEETEDASICIIGGGVSGLAAAISAMEEGAGRGGKGKRLKTVLIEMDDKVGGRVRSDVTEEGFVLDRGFAVFIEEYPQAKQLLNYTALGLHPFQPGALVVREGGALERVADPLRQPWDLLVALTANVGTFADKLRILAVLGTVFTKTPAELFAEPETDTLTCLRERYEFSEEMIAQFFQPFLQGIYLAPLEEQSSRMFHFIFQMFSKGSASLPTGGMGAVAQQLAAKATKLGVDIRCGSTVELVQMLPEDKTVDASRCRFLVTLSNGERIRSSSVIIATEGPQANFLLGCLGKGWEELLLAAQNGQTQPQEQREVGCLYYLVDNPPPVQDSILVLNGEATKRGTMENPINNLCFPSVVNPSYAPPNSNRTLASVTVLKNVMDAYIGREQELDRAVRRQLSGWAFPAVDRWKLLGVYGISYAQPAHFGGEFPANVYEGRNCSTYLNRTLPEGLYVCGDHMATATFNGALTSGCNAGKAAAAVAELVERVQEAAYTTSTTRTIASAGSSKASPASSTAPTKTTAASTAVVSPTTSDTNATTSTMPSTTTLEASVTAVRSMASGEATATTISANTTNIEDSTTLTIASKETATDGPTSTSAATSPTTTARATATTPESGTAATTGTSTESGSVATTTNVDKTTAAKASATTKLDTPSATGTPSSSSGTISVDSLMTTEVETEAKGESATSKSTSSSSAGAITSNKPTSDADFATSSSSKPKTDAATTVSSSSAPSTKEESSASYASRSLGEKTSSTVVTAASDASKSLGEMTSSTVAASSDGVDASDELKKSALGDTADTETTATSAAASAMPKSPTSSASTSSVGDTPTAGVGAASVSLSSAVGSASADTQVAEKDAATAADTGVTEATATSTQEAKGAWATADYLKRLSSSYYDLPLKPKPEAQKVISRETMRDPASKRSAEVATDDDQSKAPANTTETTDKSSSDVRKKAEGMWLIQAMKFVLSQGRRRREKSGNGDHADNDDDGFSTDFVIPRLEEVGVSSKSNVTPGGSSATAATSSGSGGVAAEASTMTAETAPTSAKSATWTPFRKLSSKKQKKKTKAKGETGGKEKTTITPPQPPLMVYPVGPYDYDDE